MTKHAILAAAALLALGAGSAFAVDTTSFIVTAEAPKSAPPPTLTGHDVIGQVSNQPASVTAWHAVKEDPAGLELWILIDDGTNTSIGTQFNDIGNFICQQPPQVKVAIGYIHNGSVQTVKGPTADHEAAAKAIRLPYGQPGISASPYIALAEFLHKLPSGPQPREVVLISSGIDPYYPGFAPENPYLQNAIHNAQKAGVPVNTIYYSSAGHAGHSYWLITWGQNDLSELSEETGGEFYWQGFSNPVAFQPFFAQINRRIGEQYVMRLDVPKPHSGLQRLQLHTEAPHVSLTGPAQVYIP